MKAQRCSWVDMLKIREALSAGKRGDQAHLRQLLGCVDHSTISQWKAALDAIQAVDGKCYLNNISHLQPTHAAEITRTIRKLEGNKPAKEWSEESKERALEWIERVEEEKLTVQQLKKALVAERREEAAAAVAEQNKAATTTTTIPPEPTEDELPSNEPVSGSLFDDACEEDDEADERDDSPIEPDVQLEPASDSLAAVVGMVRHCSMQELLGSQTGIHAIITDPPYPEEFLPLYGELAELAAKSLTPDGILAVMCGQSHLPKIMELMTPHMPYRWTIAYLTPGGQSVQLFPRKVNTFWKPILLFGASRDWIGDVVHSNVNDNDKKHHHWGQSESGMARLVERLTLPGHLVCDPFLGAGTTGVVAVGLGRRFIGCDIDAEHVLTARTRMQVALESQQGQGR